VGFKIKNAFGGFGPKFNYSFLLWNYSFARKVTVFVKEVVA